MNEYDETWRPAEGESLAAGLNEVRADLHRSLTAIGGEAAKVGDRVDLQLVGIEAIIRGKEQGGPGWVDWSLNVEAANRLRVMTEETEAAKTEYLGGMATLPEGCVVELPDGATGNYRAIRLLGGSYKLIPEVQS